MLLPELQSLRLHPQRIPRVVCQATRDGGLVVEENERRRGLPADSLEPLSFRLQLLTQRIRWGRGEVLELELPLFGT